MVRYLRKDELMHYGRSIKDGAPGVGTGNWKRTGSYRVSESAARNEYLRGRDNIKAGKTYALKKSIGLGQYHNRIDRSLKEVISAVDVAPATNVAELIGSGKADYLKRYKNADGYAVYDCNPGFGSEGHSTHDNIRYRHSHALGTTNNCVKCTAAMEMMNRGWDVRAGRSFKGAPDGAMTYWFDGAVQYKEKGSENFANRMQKVLGNNGRGEIICKYPDNNGGHSMYTRVKDGHVIFEDGQCARKQLFDATKEGYSQLTTYLKDTYGFDLDNKYSRITRLDTATPNFTHMAEDSTLRMDYRDSNMNKLYSKKYDQYANIWADDKGRFGYDTYGDNLWKK